jgi:hypothetical protein
MQTALTIAIVLGAALYLAWVWAPKRKSAQAGQSAGSVACGPCTGCAGCGGH